MHNETIHTQISMMKKFISATILPRFSSIESFDINEVRLNKYDKKLLNTKQRFQITFYVDGIEEQDEVEIEDLILGMKDYLGIPMTTKIHLDFQSV
jgi:hypothetical protein